MPTVSIPKAPAFRLLGELEVESVARAELGGPKQRTLLVVLMLRANELVSRDRLIDAIWGETPPASAPAIVHGYVNKLRGALACTPGRIATRSPGYVLELDEDDVDARRFERLSRAGRDALLSGDHEGARTMLAEALALWRGDAMADLAFEPSLGDEVRRLERLRLEATMDRIEAELELGDGTGLTGELESLVARHPLDERPRGQLMLALYRAGRQADALGAYQSARTVLAGELGLEPGPALRDLERRILQHDPSLESPRRISIAARRSRRRRVAAMGTALIFAAAATAVGLLLPGGSQPERNVAAGRQEANRLAVINAGASSVSDATELPGEPADLAVGLGSIWVADPSGQRIVRIDAATGAVSDRIPIAGQPARVAIAGGAVWVASTLGGRVSRVDPGAGEVTQVVRLSGTSATDIATGAGAIWVADSTNRSMIEIDPATGSERRRIGLDLMPTALAVGSGVMWVADFDSGVVEEVDIRSGRAIATFPVGQGPSAIAVGPDAVWVANSLDATISRIDPATNSVRATVPVPSGPSAIVATSRSVWVASADAGSISEIDPRTNVVVSSHRIGGRPQALAAAGGRIWVGAGSLGESHHGGTLAIVRVGRFATIDPAFNLDGVFSFTRPNYDTLVTFQSTAGPPGLRLLPDLAVAVPRPTNGGTTLFFRLRPGIRYSDGTMLRARDFRRGIERLFRVDSPGASYYAGVVGAGQCHRQPRTCNLAEGIQTDDGARTVIFRLRAPDPDFLFKLAVVGFGSPVPPGTPDRDVGASPIPGTGPYRIARTSARELRLERNPFFREWSHAAQPAGNPDAIVWSFASSVPAAVKDVEQGRADWLFGLVRPSELHSLEVRYPSQIHVNPSPIVQFIPLNTHRRPFDDVRVRRALNDAVDRARIAGWYGGAHVATPLCQPLAPGLPGYRRYCPYTRNPRADGRWSAPDLTRAKRLVAASGTVGQRVDVWGPTDNISMPPELAPYIAKLLRSLGFRVRLHLVPSATITPSVRRSAQLTVDGDWMPDYPAPSAYLPQFFGCHGGTSNGYICDPSLDRQMQRASTMQATDSQAAAALWSTINRRIVDEAAWVPTVNLRAPEFVSKRVRNYLYSPVGGFIADQVWLR